MAFDATDNFNVGKPTKKALFDQLLANDVALKALVDASTGPANRGWISDYTLESRDKGTLKITGLSLRLYDGTTEFYLYQSAEILIDVVALGLTDSTLYYVYVDAPAASGAITATDIEISSTAPAWVESKKGYYKTGDASQRCIGEFYAETLVVGDDFGPRPLSTSTANFLANGNVSIAGGKTVFDGSGDWLEWGDYHSRLLPEQGREMCWELQVAHTDHAGTENYFSWYGDANHYGMIEHVHGSGVRFFIRDSAATQIDTGYSGEIADTDEHHVMVYYDGIGNWGVYQDGAQLDYLSDNVFSQLQHPDFAIGARDDGTNPFDGTMDNVRITHGNPYGLDTPDAGLADTYTPPAADTDLTWDDDTVFLLAGTSGVGVGRMFKRVGDRVDIEGVLSDIAIYENESLEQDFEVYDLPDYIPSGCTQLDLIGATGTTYMKQIISTSGRYEDAIEFNENAVGWTGGRYYTGSSADALQHDGGLQIYAAADDNGTYNNQYLYIRGYELKR